VRSAEDTELCLVKQPVSMRFVHSKDALSDLSFEAADGIL